MEEQVTLITTNYTFVTVAAAKVSLKCRVYMADVINTEVKALLVVGPEQLCKGVFANLNTGNAVIRVDDRYVKRCEFHYTRRHHPLPAKWCAMMIMSKDPRCLWNDGKDGLLSGIKRLTETPILEEWEPYLRDKLRQSSKLCKLTGYQSVGSFLDCNTEDVDSIVSDGIIKRAIDIRGSNAKASVP